jgi:ABC-type antimicrobial peptide transport system permease subunit
VGIAENMVQRDLTAAHRYHYYLSIDQFTRTSGNGLLLLLRGDPAVQGESVRKQLQRVMPGASYVTVRPLADIVAAEQKSWRMGATLLVLFGGLALVVAAVGLYGVISYNVAQRMHELGVRSALGATPFRILNLVVGQSLRFISIGVSVGIVLALIVSRWVQPLLFRQSATDPAVYVAVASVMIVVAIGASASPAFLASKADPNRALRVD